MLEFQKTDYKPTVIGNPSYLKPFPEFTRTVSFDTSPFRVIDVQRSLCQRNLSVAVGNVIELMRSTSERLQAGC